MSGAIHNTEMKFCRWFLPFWRW